MSWAKAAKKICKNNNIAFSGDNSEGWVPAGDSYPHVHFGTSFIRYRHAHGAGGSVCANGENLLSPINDVIKELEDGDMKTVLEGLVDTYEVK